MQTLDIGFIGLGVMGAPMAGHLASAGHRLRLHDADVAVADALAKQFAGATTACATPAALAEGCDIVVTMLPNGQVVQQVALGEHGLRHGLKRGALLLDTSSAEPWLTRATAATLAEHGVAMVDAPVSGAQWGAQEANLVFMVGGAAGDVQRVRPLLDLMGRAVFHVGALGAGHAMKCINNLITSMTFSATMEGLVIGKRFGLDPAAMVDVLDESTGGSWISKNHIRQRVLSRSFDDPFKLDLMLKDIGIAMELGREAQLPLPLSGLGQQLWRAAALAAGVGASVSELARWVEQQAQVPVTPGARAALMEIERRLADFVCTLQARDMPADAQRTVRLVLRAAAGTGIAAAAEDGIAELRALLLERGGAAQARTLVFGDRLPATAAAQLNGTMCRALDFCDAMAPGPHIGSSLLPAALAAADLAGGCSGADFLAALAAGAELSARFNLSEMQYDGFDPTGVCVVFAAAAAAARILQLTPQQTLHALALAFNRCGGSFQSNVDGSLAVRAVQGWVAETGVACAQMAQRGFTGPVNFLSGVYGYAHLYGRGTLDARQLADGLGDEWRLQRMMFKKYPSCGATQGMTELTLQLVAELDLRPEQVQGVTVRLNPYCFKLVGQPFRVGDNPRVDAQFSAQYCVANAIVRRSSALDHFRVERIVEPAVLQMVARVRVESHPALDVRGHTAVDVALHTTDGRVHERALDIAPGYPGNPLGDAQQRDRFDACMAYAPRPLPAAQAEAFLLAVEQLGELDDARRLAELLVVPGAPG